MNSRPILPFALACALVTSVLSVAPAAHAVALESALSDLAERVADNPRDAALLTDYANLLVQAGRYDQARETYKAALDADPDSMLGHYNLGLLELEFGRARKAKRHFKESLNADPSFARARYGLGDVAVARNNHPRAVDHYAEALTLDPQLLDVEQNPALLFNRLATWASMKSYLENSASRGTRLYNDPKPIVGLLIPGLEEMREFENEAADDAEATEDARAETTNAEGGEEMEPVEEEN